jgi:hypothetical protein
MAARGSTLQVKDYQKFMLTLASADKGMRRVARAEIRKAGDYVKTDASARFQRYDAKTAAGYRVVVRRRGVAVEQALRKTTGKRADFGTLQWERALGPAADENADKTRQAIDQAFDAIAARFNT